MTRLALAAALTYLCWRGGKWVGGRLATVLAWVDERPELPDGGFDG